MADIVLNADRFSTTEIAQMFTDYIGRMQDQERHTPAACKEVDAFDTCCSSEFPYNVRLQNLMYERMMDVAVEFEESGFIAGFQTAMALLSGQEELLPQPTQISTPKEEKRVQEAVTASKGQNKVAMTKYIDTTQIAEMYGRTNFKTCRTIRDSILPYLNETEKAGFVEDVIRQPKKREQKIFKLSFAACKKYLEYFSDKGYYTNVREGNEKLKKKMEETFCSACVA